MHCPTDHGDNNPSDNPSYNRLTLYHHIASNPVERGLFSIPAYLALSDGARPSSSTHMLHVINYCTPLLVATQIRQASGAFLLQLPTLHEDAGPIAQGRYSLVSEVRCPGCSALRPWASRDVS